MKILLALLILIPNLSWGFEDRIWDDKSYSTKIRFCNAIEENLNSKMGVGLITRELAEEQHNLWKEYWEKKDDVNMEKADRAFNHYFSEWQKTKDSMTTDAILYNSLCKGTF